MLNKVFKGVETLHTHTHTTDNSITLNKRVTKESQSKKGISLIVLVITIIVIIILAAAVILTLTNNNPIENAKQAAFVNDLSSFQDELDMYKANEYAKNLGDFDPTSLNASSTNTTLLYTYIPSLEGKTKYENEIAVVEGKLRYTGDDDTKKTWATSVNIEIGTEPIIPPDTTAPTVTFTPNTGSNATQVSTTVSVTDASGLNESTLQYVWDTQNVTEPTTGWATLTNNTAVTKTGTGIYYLWIKASDNASNEVVTKSGVFAIGDVDIPVGTIQTEHKTFAGATTGFAHNNPVIPAGFVAVNTTNASWNNLSTDWNNGLVIQDANGNQFVWVPVNVDVPYAKWCTIGNLYNGDDTLPSGVVTETGQIDTYKGFYIARYEAGNVSSTVVSKKGSTVWNNISYTNSKIKAQAMYTSTKVKSGIVTGTMWDTILKWVQNSGKSVTDSRAWGNYAGAIAPANVSGYGTLKTAGYSNNWQTKNVYDLAGNISEWTTEMNGSSLVHRGGYYLCIGTDDPAAYRNLYDVNNIQPHIGFRVVLYIL